MESTHSGDSILPSSILNFRTMSADIVWIRTLLHFGENKRRGVHSPATVLSAGRQIANFDPLFKEVYSTFPALVISGRSRLNEAELEEITRFLEEGIVQFPNDPELPFRAALNFIGYSEGADNDRRLREIERAIRLLHISIARDPSALDSTNVLRWFLKRRARLLGEMPDRKEEIELLEGLLLQTSDARVRESILTELEAMGITLGGRASNLLSSSFDYLPNTVSDMLTEVEQ